jgi:hypothetical protein
MVIPVPQLPEKHREFDPTEKAMALIKPTKHDNNLEIHEGEMLIMLDTEKNDWFLAEVAQKHQHKIVVNYYNTLLQLSRWKDTLKQASLSGRKGYLKPTSEKRGLSTVAKMLEEEI